eukprot:1704757-Pleurochrysis_carterae.AAC.1
MVYGADCWLPQEKVEQRGSSGGRGRSERLGDGLRRGTSAAAPHHLAPHELVTCATGSMRTCG